MKITVEYDSYSTLIANATVKPDTLADKKFELTIVEDANDPTLPKKLEFKASDATGADINLDMDFAELKQFSSLLTQFTIQLAKK